MQTVMEEIETHWENYVERKMQESEERANAKTQGKFCLDSNLMNTTYKNYFHCGH